MNKKSKKGGARRKERKYSGADYLRLFVVYWLIIFMLVVLALFSVGQWFPGWLKVILYLSSLVFAGIATYVHVTPGKKSKFDREKIDDMANELK